jgi:hypothetical protein
VQHGLASADHNDMAGVVAALEADDGVRPLRQQVDGFALPLIVPMSACHCHSACHVRPSR